MGALPTGADQRVDVRRPRTGGGRSRRRARAGRRRRRRAAQPRARHALRPRRHGGGRVPQLPRPRRRPDVRPRREHALRCARARRLPARLDARQPLPRRRRRRARVQAARRAARGADLPRRGSVLSRRCARRPQPRRCLAGSRRLRPAIERLLVLDAELRADGEHKSRRADSGRLVDPRRARRRNGCDGRVRCDQGCGRASACR